MTGLLALDLDDLVAYTRSLLLDEALRTGLGSKAQLRSREFSWSATAALIEGVLTSAGSVRSS